MRYLLLIFVIFPLFAGDNNLESHFLHHEDKLKYLEFPRHHLFDCEKKIYNWNDLSEEEQVTIERFFIENWGDDWNKKVTFECKINVFNAYQDINVSDEIVLSYLVSDTTYVMRLYYSTEFHSLGFDIPWNLKNMKHLSFYSLSQLESYQSVIPKRKKIRSISITYYNGKLLWHIKIKRIFKRSKDYYFDLYTGEQVKWRY